MKSRFPRWTCLAACLALAPLAIACGDDDGESIFEPVDAGASGSDAGTADAGIPSADELAGLARKSGHETVAAKDVDRDGAGDVLDVDLKAFTRSQREFNAGLFGQLSGEFAGKNAMVSALSVHQALGMAWAGARGETASQMAAVLKMDANGHAVQNALSLELDSRNLPAEETEYFSYDAVELAISNAFWAGKGLAWKDGFLDTLARYYGAGVETLDFQNAPDASRQYINAWVASQTRNRIPELIPEGGVDASTVSVLTNAVYFKAPWSHEFSPSATRDGIFTLADGKTSVTVPFVSATDYAPYAEGDGWKATEKSFRGGRLAMLFILPDAGRFNAVAGGMDADAFDGVVSAMSRSACDVELTLPKFQFSTAAELNDALVGMGMDIPFDGRRSDFSGMSDDARIWIDKVIHQTFIALDEKGVEAAAATAVAMAGATAIEPQRREFKADRPFVFAIRDVATGAVLFYGQVIDPTAK